MIFKRKMCRYLSADELHHYAGLGLIEGVHIITVDSQAHLNHEELVSQLEHELKDAKDEVLDRQVRIDELKDKLLVVADEISNRLKACAR